MEANDNGAPWMGRHLSSHHPSGSYVLQDVVLERAPVGHDETFGREFLFEYYPAVAFDHSLGHPAVGGFVVPCNKVNFHRPVPFLMLCKQALYMRRPGAGSAADGGRNRNPPAHAPYWLV